MSRKPDVDYYFAFLLMCGYYLSAMEGDTHRIEDAYALMKEHGIVDEDGFPTGEDE